MVAEGVQESGLNLGISWKYDQEDLDEWHVGDEIIKDNSGRRIEGPYPKMSVCQTLENVLRGISKS